MISCVCRNTSPQATSSMICSRWSNGNAAPPSQPSTPGSRASLCSTSNNEHSASSMIMHVGPADGSTL